MSCIQEKTRQCFGVPFPNTWWVTCMTIIHEFSARFANALIRSTENDVQPRSRLILRTRSIEICNECPLQLPKLISNFICFIIDHFSTLLAAKTMWHRKVLSPVNNESSNMQKKAFVSLSEGRMRKVTLYLRQDTEFLEWNWKLVQPEYEGTVSAVHQRSLLIHV
jgi:hypothetical protein